ncbi:LCP family glycopolymer transferase [Clostridia bacterium]|jgi:transcriptional regulator, lytR family
MRKENNPESRHAAPKGGKPVKRHRYKKSVRVTVSILSSLMVVVSVLLMTAGGYVMHAMNLIVGDEEIDGNYVDSLPPDDEDPDVSIDTSFNPSDYDKSEVSKITLRGNTKDVTNLLLLGIDARTMKERGRSDSMIIVTINKKNKTIKLSSLLRDTAVTIPGRDKNGDGQDDYAKLNAAYAYGGFNLLSKTIEQNFRLKIDKYVGVNFVVFPIAVDAMGGIDIYMTAKEASKVCAPGQKLEDWERGFKKIGTESKVYHLNGYQALQYSRIRHIDSDFNRTGRQRKVIEQLIVKAKTMSFGTLNTILNQVLPQVATNMSGDELMGYALNAGSYANYAIDTSFHLPENGKYKGWTLPGGGASLRLTDPVESVKSLHEWIYS